jgi:glycosyltransferase involved in cell wall biosynthesis
MIVEQVIPKAKASGVAVVVEVDDNFHALSQSNPAFGNTHTRMNPDNNRSWLKKACSLADLVTVTTPALAIEYGGHGRAAVLPNCVPEWYTDIPHEDTGRAGWTGAFVWHVEDLEMIKGKLSNSVPFTNIGDEQVEPYFPNEDIHTIPFKPLNEYPHEIAKLSVGIVPLVDNAFNRGKSALKATEYAACGVFPLMSPMPDQIRLHEQYGIGEIVTKPKYWDRTVQWWLTHDEERRKRTSEARQIVREQLTYETRAEDWMTAWRKAASNAATRAESVA